MAMSSSVMQASGDKFALGCGRVVFRSFLYMRRVAVSLTNQVQLNMVERYLLQGQDNRKKGKERECNVLPQKPSGKPVSRLLSDILGDGGDVIGDVVVVLAAAFVLVGLLGVLKLTSAMCSIIDQPTEAGGALRNFDGLRILEKGRWFLY